jgi:glycosyltransferase involved in cell wall biosynthesis
MILNGCGIIVEPEDISGLADKIDWVCSNTLEAEKMGRRAREKCIADYSWDVMEEKLVAIFEKYK